jgi:hypothetical protein
MIEFSIGEHLSPNQIVFADMAPRKHWNNVPPSLTVNNVALFSVNETTTRSRALALRCCYDCKATTTCVSCSSDRDMARGLRPNAS